MIIPKRFNGPPDSGNGGYTAGLVATEYVLATAGTAASASATAVQTAPAAPGGGAGVEVTLRVPPPLDTTLTVVRDDTGIAVRHADTLVATARPATVTDVVPAVAYREAERASRGYPGFTGHPFPTCYTCGPDRTDGLRVFPGRLADGRTAAPFVVPQDVTAETVWAALDCPGGWTVPQETRPHVLGRIAARVDAVPPPGTRCVVTARLVAGQGRKAEVLTTVWPAGGGTPFATARATWIALR